MNRYQILFKKLQINNEGCLMPFLVLGDPSIKLSLKIINDIISYGIDAIEIGIPFSDPLADGPIIQNSNLRAFKSGITVNKCFNMISIIRKLHPTIPIGLLIYANIIFNYGIDEFYYKCSTVGIDSVLIADVPMEEYKPFRKSAIIHNISPVFICPPNADNNLIKKISLHSNSYIYVVSYSGVTGFRKKTQTQHISHFVTKFRKHCSVPLLQGFGIYNSSQINNAIVSGMSGVICGSVIIKIIEKYNYNIELMLKKIKKLIIKFKQCTKK